MLFLWIVLRGHLQDARWAPPGRTAKNRQLAKDSLVVVPQLKRALREIVRIHKHAAIQNPFSLPDAKRLDGQPWWSECQTRYEDALKTLDADPTLAFLRSRSRHDAPAGNPVKRRNGRIRRELQKHKIDRGRITTILQALRFLR
jgi:hypothetical protein